MKNKIDEIIDRFKSPLDGEISVYSMADYIFELERKLQNTSSNSDYAVTPSASPKYPEYDYIRDMFPNVDTVLLSTIYHAIKYSGNFA